MYSQTQAVLNAAVTHCGRDRGCGHLDDGLNFQMTKQ